MVTIFDMVTGELIHSDASADKAQPEQSTREHEMLAPRLQTVEEAIATERQQRGMPADLLNTDIGSFVDTQ